MKLEDYKFVRGDIIKHGDYGRCKVVNDYPTGMIHIRPLKNKTRLIITNSKFCSPVRYVKR